MLRQNLMMLFLFWFWALFCPLAFPALCKREEIAVWRSTGKKSPSSQVLFYFWVKESSHAAFLHVSDCPMDKDALVSGQL